jgi:hypothetical protein
MPDFIPGLKLSHQFYTEIISPLLSQKYGHIKYSVALIGSGSEVLGFDTVRSTDHHWGPRLMIFLSAIDYERYAAEISQYLSDSLPYSFRGYSTNFTPPNLEDNGVRLLKKIDSGSVNHMIDFHTIQNYFTNYLGIDPYNQLSSIDWLTLPEQRLLTITAGAVFHDGLSDLKPIQEKFKYYPLDVWLYLLSAQWTRISQEEPFMGRCGEVGDELGSRIIAARLIRDLMKLCFLMEKKYAPYSKWFGTAFSQLECASKLKHHFLAVLSSDTWHKREQPLVQAYEKVLNLHNNLQITKPVEVKTSHFHGRPFQVIHAERIAAQILEKIQDPAIKALQTPIGALDQYANSTDLTTSPHLYRRLKILYE